VITTRPAVVAFLVATLPGACRAKPNGPPPWEVGYWYWRHAAHEAGPVHSRVTPDVVYVQVGVLSPSGIGESRWPSSVPPAKSYVATWRSDEQKPPDPALVAVLAKAHRRVEAEAAALGQHVVGLQLDIDCPTRSLPAYADFLRSLRREVGSTSRISITALLDWFRRDTQVRPVVTAVDEYVPQFYDARPSGPGGEIAEPIAAERWAPILNELGTPYKIGIAVFGRIQRVRSQAGGADVREAFRDATLLDLWSRGLGPPRVETGRAGERVLRWQAARRLPPALEAGDRVQAIIPTSASVRAAYAAARAFGGLCSGVVFFRWPGSHETLALYPDEITEALAGVKNDGPPELRAADGACVDRACADLTARLQDRFPTAPIELRLEASTDVEYLVPTHAAVTLRQIAARQIVVVIPPFVGERQVLLGRVFSRQPARYEVRPTTP
jgi:hypothetical protein